MKRVFLSVFNHGAIELAINHLRSLINVGISNYIAYVTDRESFDQLTSLNFNVKLMDNANGSMSKEGQDFGTDDFKKITWMRYTAIRELLLQDYEVWYMDIDAVVLKNLNMVSPEIAYDIVFQHDLNSMCTGCMLMRPTCETIDLVTQVINKIDDFVNDQTAMNYLLKELNITYCALSPFNFPNGALYFDTDIIPFSDKDFKPLRQNFRSSSEPVFFVHANYMIGIKTKIDALKSRGLWYL